MAGNVNELELQDEIHEWMTINRKFRRRGLSSIRVLPSREVNLSSDRYVCLDLESSQALRTSVTLFITELDRKDNILQDLKQANNELRDEAEHLTEETRKLNTKIKDIKVVLECSRARVQELEGDKNRPSSSRLSDEGGKLQKAKSALATRCRQLEAKIAEQDKELTRLRREIIAFAKEDEHRSKQQSQGLKDVRKRKPTPYYPMNDNNGLKCFSLVCIKDGKIDDGSLKVDKGSHGSEHVDDLKDILKSYEKQLQEKNRKIKSLKEQRDVLKQDIGTRLELKDYRLLSQRVKKLEGLLALHNISIPGEMTKRDPFGNKQKLNPQVDELDSLPLEQCHHYLRELCAELGTTDLDCLADLVRDIKDDAASCRRFQEYCQKLSEIVESMNENNHRHRSYRPDRDLTTLLCDSNMRYYLGVVENWCKDISGLGELQNAINNLLDKVVPWVHARMEHDHSVTEMAELIERVTHADKSERKAVLMEDVSRGTLESIVSHFQTLFDVPKISGVFPWMNEIYRVLGESRNVQNTLKNLLGIPSNTSPAALVDAVGKLVHRYNSTTAEQLKKLMQTDDLNSVIKRLHEHKEFFPAFKVVMEKLFDILGVSKMDEVVPAVRALKLLAS